MTSRKRSLSSLGVLAGVLAIAAPAWACTNYVGKATLTGNASANTTVSTGQQCGDNANGSLNSNCTGGMTLTTTAAPGASSHLGGTLNISTAAATTGSCTGHMPAWVCQLNNSSAINFPTGNSGYDVNIINVGFSSHTQSPTDSNKDCMTWVGNPNAFIKVATVTVSGGAGALSAASGANGYSASFSSGVATVAVPGAPWSVNSGTQEAGVCISDVKGEDGIQAPFKIVT